MALTASEFDPMARLRDQEMRRSADAIRPKDDTQGLQHDRPIAQETEILDIEEIVFELAPESSNDAP